jgi:hypothetical protein
VKPRAIVRLKGLRKWKKSKTTCSEAHLASCLMDIKGIFLGVKRNRLEAGYSHITSAEVKKTWIKKQETRSKKYNSKK